MTVDCSDSADVFWMLLTFMTLSPREQLRHLPDIPKRSQDELLDSARTNPLVALTVALQTHSWWDDFDPDVEKLDAFYAALNRLATVHNRHLYCREEFLHGREWSELRQLAKAALEESTMGPHPIPDRIDFQSLIEFTD